MDEDQTIIRPRPGRDQTSASPAGPDASTIVRPRPGGHHDGVVIRPRSRRPYAAGEEATQIRPRSRGPDIPLTLRRREHLDTSLTELAHDLLALVTELRSLQRAPDVAQLHKETVQLLQQFRDNASAAHVASESVNEASYLLCSLIDETVLNSRWGESSSWSQNSLLRVFHRETYGGNHAFLFIEAALANRNKNPDFLQLCYCCLALGFEGKYRIEPRGHIRLEQLRKEIYRALGEQRDGVRRELAPGVRPAAGVARRLHSYLSLWVLAAVLALVMAAVYSHLLSGLDQRSNSVMAELSALIPAQPDRSFIATAPRSDVVRLQELLAPEIERGVLNVEQDGPRLSVVLQAETLFAAGSADIAPEFLPILDKIGKALEAIAGRIVVVGHSDSSAIRTARFPSNWHLSLARASEVAKYLSSVALLQGRLVPEGRGDLEPVATNMTAAGRARNRRVVIELYPSAGGESERLEPRGRMTSDPEI